MEEGNHLNPAKGKMFEELAKVLLDSYFNVNFDIDYPIAIGSPPKEHKFDLVAKDTSIIAECKNHSWTKSGNVPCAKMGFVNEAVFYLSFLPNEIKKYVVMRKDVHPKRKESLAEYYHRTYRHLLKGVVVIEIDDETKIIKEINSKNNY